MVGIRLFPWARPNFSDYVSFREGISSSSAKLLQSKMPSLVILMQQSFLGRLNLNYSPSKVCWNMQPKSTKQKKTTGASIASSTKKISTYHLLWHIQSLLLFSEMCLISESLIILPDPTKNWKKNRDPPAKLILCVYWIGHPQSFPRPLRVMGQGGQG